jgi:hypothetical protein
LIRLARKVAEATFPAGPATDSGYFSRPPSIQHATGSTSLSQDRFSNTFAGRDSFCSQTARYSHASNISPYGNLSTADRTSYVNPIGEQIMPNLDQDTRNITPNVDRHPQPVSSTVYGNGQDQTSRPSLSIPSRAFSAPVDACSEITTRRITSKKATKDVDPFHNKYQCTYCSKRFANEGNRELHEKEIHNSLHTYACFHSECNGREFSSKKGFDTHHRSAHEGCPSHSTCPNLKHTLKRPSKMAAACGACGMLFRDSKTLLKERSDHIHRHYSREDSKYIYHWKENHWNKTKIVNAFLRVPEVRNIWLNYKVDRFLEAESLNCWDNADDNVFDKFIELAEFGDFSLEHMNAIVEMAYELVDKRPRPSSRQAKSSTSSSSSRTHSRADFSANHSTVRHAPRSVDSSHVPLQLLKGPMTEADDSILPQNLNNNPEQYDPTQFPGALAEILKSCTPHTTTTIPIHAESALSRQSTTKQYPDSPILPTINSHGFSIPWSSTGIIEEGNLMSNVTHRDPHHYTNPTYSSDGSRIAELQIDNSVQDMQTLDDSIYRRGYPSDVCDSGLWYGQYENYSQNDQIS